ncbi:hypothetical protein [Hyalangium versicolor]|uniref:hypothetical protein n=1 Tax=Hyalangium versicolor TaxID=2861190 RepID=UPI001CCED683|nr:hypothetical protein [Hyalangium versicolor]
MTQAEPSVATQQIQATPLCPAPIDPTQSVACPPCPIDLQRVDGTCTPPPPPAQRPSIPGSLSYPSYLTRPSYLVSWGSSTGYGLPVTYQLEEQISTGVWQQLSSTSSLSSTMSGRASNVYKYRVRACNSVGCSGYTTGSALVVNLPPVTDVYADYPFLHDVDQENTQYAASSQGFRTGFQSSSSAQTRSDVRLNPLPVVDGQFYLGQGYNVLKDDYAQNCIDTNRPGFQILSNPVNYRSISVERAASVSQLSQLLDVNMSGGFSLGVDGYSVDLSGSKKRYSEQVGDSYQEWVVVRWEQQIDHWTLDTSVDPMKPAIVSQMIVPGNVNAQRAFREFCGDKYVYAVVRGAKLYMVFRFDTKSYSLTERAQKAAGVVAKIKEVLNANGSSTVSEETRLYLEQLKVTIKAYTVGGDKEIESIALTGANFATKFQEFVNSVSVSNSAAVEQSMSHYVQPPQFYNYDYFQLFADYRVPAEQLRRWNTLDLEREQRCQLIQTYGYAAGASANCNWGKQELETAKSYCIETASWSKCAHPLSYYTGNLGPLGSGTLLYNWLGQNISSLERTTSSNYFDHHVSGGFWNKECGSFTDDTCLPMSGCVVDAFLGGHEGVGKGFDRIVSEWDGPGDGSTKGIPYIVSNGAMCVRTASTLCTSRFGDTTADYKFDQVIYGQCPYTRQFAIVP